jgi:hypothetical protein
VSPYFIMIDDNLPVTATYQSSATSASGSSPWTFTAMSIGTASSTRRVFVAIAAPSTSTALNPAIDAVSIGGVSATLYGTRRHTSNTYHEVSFWYADVSSGTTADVVVTGATGHNRASMTVAGVWTLDNSLLLNNQPTDDAFDNTASAGTLTASLDVLTGGFILSVVCRQSASGTYTFSGVTERYDVDAGNQIVGSASDNFASGQAVNVVATPSASSATQVLYAVAGR